VYVLQYAQGGAELATISNTYAWLNFDIGALSFTWCLNFDLCSVNQSSHIKGARDCAWSLTLSAADLLSRICNVAHSFSWLEVETDVTSFCNVTSIIAEHGTAAAVVKHKA
jgi:hypothetical protein